uniref:Putative HNH homing endonuclease n=1 Tax=Uronema confervicola TaxID=764120 RepID=A0A6H1U834_9CHLO|nr:putative HNH homing endonuclease [Uronema confervicola]QIZ74193.1 putative HNH homing endonuclease [Uronema confervicola]
MGEKPMICQLCEFEAINSRQIELHHSTEIDPGPKNSRNKEYYTTTEVTPICANCHSLEHRTGEKLRNKCGIWHEKLPGNQKYKNPDDIFMLGCPETYRVQKEYYLKWHLVSPIQYKCQKCNVFAWAPENKILSLELHHKDRNHSNSMISNLELLCANCHRAES